MEMNVFLSIFSDLLLYFDILLHANDLMQNCSIPSADALEILYPCPEPLIFSTKWLL